jgi:peptide/nickel transport system ATP-binding protein
VVYLDQVYSNDIEAHIGYVSSICVVKYGQVLNRYTQYHSSTLDPNKTVHWILKQPLIHFHYPKAIHEDFGSSVLE